MQASNASEDFPPGDGGAEPTAAGKAASQALPQTAAATLASDLTNVVDSPGRLAGSFSGNPSQLRISEIFHSLQGETSRAGFPTVFIRLTGCPLRCTYCDTEYAFSGGQNMALGAILDQVANHDTRYVTVTGGEPLAQRNCLVLLRALCDEGYEVSLETSGALDVSEVDARVMKVLDIKTPTSGESAKNLWNNLDALNPRDEIKFVLSDEQDYAWARKVLQEYGLHRKCGVLFSPVTGRLPATQLADWILRDRLPVRMQIQLHKILWGNQPGH